MNALYKVIVSYKIAHAKIYDLTLQWMVHHMFKCEKLFLSKV